MSSPKRPATGARCRRSLVELRARDRSPGRPDPVAARPARRGGEAGRRGQAPPPRDLPRPGARARRAGAPDRGRQRRLPARGGAAGVPRDHVGLPVAREPAHRRLPRPRGDLQPPGGQDALRPVGALRRRRRRWAKSSARSAAAPTTAWSPSRRRRRVWSPTRSTTSSTATSLIVGEIVIEIAHALLTRSGQTAGVERVYAHPAAAARCAAGLVEAIPGVAVMPAPSAAAAAASARDDARSAALAPALAADLFDLAVAKARLDDGPDRRRALPGAGQGAAGPRPATTPPACSSASTTVRGAWPTSSTGWPPRA